MKVTIVADEFYPFYSAGRECFGVKSTVTMSKREYERYCRFEEKFYKWQQRLDELSAGGTR